MVQKIRAFRQAVAVARPDWMPHPMLLNLIGALWAAAVIARLLAPHV